MNAASEASIDARRRAVLDGCVKELSHVRRPSVREKLLALIEQAPAAWLDSPMDVYGDGVVAALESEVADLLGKPAAAFFPTGVMAQQAALRVWAGQTGNATVALHPLSFPAKRESNALEILSGLSGLYLTREPRNPEAGEVHASAVDFGTLMLELPLREAGFVLPAWSELAAVVDAARERGAKVHFDGARLWECTTHFGRSLPEIAALADSVYVSFYKSLGGLSGAGLAGPRAFIEEARTWRHRYGGVLFHQFPAALSAMAGLRDELPRLPGYVQRAAHVAQGLREALEGTVPGFRIRPEPPHIHQFQLWLPYPAAVLDDAGLRFAEDTGISLFGKWREADGEAMSMTELTISASAMGWSREEVRSAAGAFIERVARA